MKKYANILSVCAFLIQYIVPIIIFGDVIPYTHGQLAAGLTKAGWVALAVIVIIISRKLRDKLHEFPKSLLRALALSVFPIVSWAIVFIGFKYIEAFVHNFNIYWKNILIFIIIGRLLSIISETLWEKEP